MEQETPKPPDRDPDFYIVQMARPICVGGYIA